MNKEELKEKALSMNDINESYHFDSDELDEKTFYDISDVEDAVEEAEIRQKKFYRKQIQSLHREVEELKKLLKRSEVFHNAALYNLKQQPSKDPILLENHIEEIKKALK